MGALVYDGDEIVFDDRILTHLQIVIVQKLRKNEGFVMSWINTVETSARRTSIWLHPSIPIRFDFVGSRVPLVNPAWLALLRDSADGSRGLIVRAEPASPETNLTADAAPGVNTEQARA